LSVKLFDVLAAGAVLAATGFVVLQPAGHFGAADLTTFEVLPL